MRRRVTAVCYRGQCSECFGANGCECDCHYAPVPAPKPASLTIASVNRTAGAFVITDELSEDELAEFRRAFEESLRQIQEGHAIVLQDEPDPYGSGHLRDQLGAQAARIRELEAEVGRLSLELRRADRKGRGR